MDLGGVGAVVLVTVLSALALAAPPPPPRPPAAPSTWVAEPDQVRQPERPVLLRIVDAPAAGPAAPQVVPWSAEQTDDGWRFTVTGCVPRLASMCWARVADGDDLSATPYYRLEYRAHALARSHAPLAVVALAGADAQGKPQEVSLLDAAEVLDDGQWHTVVGHRPQALRVAAQRVRVSTRDSTGWLQLRAVRLGPRPDLAPVNLGGLTAAPPPREFQQIDLSERANDTCAAVAKRILERGGPLLDGAASHAELVYGSDHWLFRFGPKDADLLRPAEDRSPDEAPAEIAGVPTTRHLCQPPGRDDRLGVLVGRKVGEVLLLLVAELQRPGPRYALPPGPKPLTDIGGFAVELRYADGSADYAFPYSLADQQHVIQRMVGTYVVPADSTRVLDQVVLHNRVWGQTISLAALTLNLSKQRLGPPPVATAPPPVVHPQPVARAPYVRVQDGRITAGNRFYEVMADCRQGFALARMVNQWSGSELTLAPSSGLEVQVGQISYTGRAFRTTAVRADGSSAVIELASAHPELPLRLTVRLNVDDSPQLGWQVSVHHDGARPLVATVRGPVLRNLRFGGPKDDAWLCFPRYASVVTNRIGSYLAPNDRAFCMQFIDAYEPKQGIGLGLLTRNLEAAPLEYGLGKTADGVSAHIGYPGDQPLAPGESRLLTPAALLFHAGDWHVAYDAYRAWLATWYRPQHAQDKDWFRRLFLMRVHLTAKAYSWAVPIYDAKRREYRVDALMAADQDYWRMKPEIVHLGGWIDYDHEYHGDFLGGDFAVQDYTGGADALRGAIARLQGHWSIPVSLYTIPDRCRKTSAVGRALGEQAAMVREDGSLLQDEQQWYVCTECRAWQDHYVAGLVRTQRETGAKAIYVDVFGYADGHRCWSKAHGHLVPSQPPRATLSLIQRLRAALPPEVAIWSEFAVSDVASQYLDGNIQYYCLNWRDYFGLTHDTSPDHAEPAPPPRDLYRFALPGVRQFVFPCGEDTWSSNTKYLFLNGQPVYDCAWCLYAGPNLERMRRSLALQRELADCFAGDQVTPDVPTLVTGVLANEFRGPRRTVWTLYNANPVVVRGAVLAVAPRDGAKYRDAWNGRPLTPVLRDGRVVLELALQPQELGCVVQE